MNVIEREQARRLYRAIEADKRQPDNQARYQKNRIERLYIAREKLIGKKEMSNESRN